MRSPETTTAVAFIHSSRVFVCVTITRQRALDGILESCGEKSDKPAID